MDVRRCNQSANVLGFSKVSLIRSRNSTISERRRRTHDMIPLGRNPTHARVGLPGRISSRALLALRCRGLRIVRCSCVYVTARLGNCTRSLQQRSRAGCLYWRSGGTSCAFASGRAVFWSHKRKEVAPLDLDLLSFGACVQKAPGWPILPHPRMHRRAFVLVPLLEIAPQWTHPQTQQNVHQQLAGLGGCRMYVVGTNSDRLGCRLDGCPALQPICKCPWLFQGLPDPQQKQHHLGKAAPDARHDSVGARKQSDACPFWFAGSDFISGVVGVALSRSADCALLLRVHHCSVGKLHEVSTATQSCRLPVLESVGTSCAFVSGRAVFCSHKRKEVAPLDLDLPSFGACVQKAPDWPIPPHPRMHRRALVPLLEIAPQWMRPQTRQNVHQQPAGPGGLQDVRRMHELRPLRMSVGWMSGAATNLRTSSAFPRSP